MPVAYIGAQEDRVILDDALCSRHVRLYHGHPGRIWSTNVHHVRVNWFGLEDEPASFALGFSATDHEPRVFGSLAEISEDEYRTRSESLADVLSTGRDLSGWVPSWITESSSS